jgi:hypothetical protein
MRLFWTVGVVLGGLLIASAVPPDAAEGAGPGKTQQDDRDEAPLAISKPVACISIDAYEQYEPLPGAELTSEEKLLVYYRPLHYKIERTGKTFRAHLTQDGEIHRRGEKAVLQRKEHMVDYDVKSESSPDFLFVRNTVALKGLKPGEYDFVIILHDELGQTPPARQALPFRIVPVKLPRPESDPNKNAP